MSKYYDEKEIWKKLMEELSEIDIDNSLFYSLEDSGFTFFEDMEEDLEFEFSRLNLFFAFRDCDELNSYDFESIDKIGEYINSHNLYQEMIDARYAYKEYLYNNEDLDDDELTKLSRKFEDRAQAYLWCKHIFKEIVNGMSCQLNEYNSIVNKANDIIR